MGDFYDYSLSRALYKTKIYIIKAQVCHNYFCVHLVIGLFLHQENDHRKLSLVSTRNAGILLHL